jgi:hypothetical protein
MPITRTPVPRHAIIDQMDVARMLSELGTEREAVEQAIIVLQ